MDYDRLPVTFKPTWAVQYGLFDYISLNLLKILLSKSLQHLLIYAQKLMSFGTESNPYPEGLII